MATKKVYRYHQIIIACVFYLVSEAPKTTALDACPVTGTSNGSAITFSLDVPAAPHSRGICVYLFRETGLSEKVICFSPQSGAIIIGENYINTTLGNNLRNTVNVTSLKNGFNITVPKEGICKIAERITVMEETGGVPDSDPLHCQSNCSTSVPDERSGNNTMTGNPRNSSATPTNSTKNSSTDNTDPSVLHVASGKTTDNNQPDVLLVSLVTVLAVFIVVTCIVVLYIVYRHKNGSLKYNVNQQDGQDKSEDTVIIMNDIAPNNMYVAAHAGKDLH